MRRSIKTVGLIGALLLQSCASPQVNDASGNHRAQVVALDEQGLWYEMDKAEKNLAQAPERITDPELDAYLREMSCELAPDICADIRIYLFRNSSFNAFMTPNGMMGIFSGLWLRCENRAQLAAVIGHEIGHYRKRHSLENWRHGKNLSRWMSAIGAVAGGTNAGALAAIGLIANSAAFSRDQEREADTEGLDAMQNAALDLTAAGQLWAGAYAEERANPPGMLSAIFASHPATAERRDRLNKLGMERPRAAVDAAKDQRFLQLLLRHRSGWLEDELARRNYSQSEVMLKRLAQFPYDRATLQHYLGELYRKRNAPGDLERASIAYRNAIRDPKSKAITHRDLGLVLLKQKQTAQAHAAFKRYLELAPKADDRAMIESMLNTLPSGSL